MRSVLQENVVYNLVCVEIIYAIYVSVHKRGQCIMLNRILLLKI